MLNVHPIVNFLYSCNIPPIIAGPYHPLGRIMVGTLIVTQPTFALSLKTPNSHTSNSTGKYKNGLSMWFYSISKVGTVCKIERERISFANNVAVKALRNSNCEDEWDKMVLNHSLLAKSSDFEDTSSGIDNSVLCSKRQLISVSAMLVALCADGKPSISVESPKQSDDNSSKESGNSATGSDSTKRESVAKKSIFGSLLNTRSWYRFRGDGFYLRVPPDFEDIMEPEDYSAGSSLYGERAKPKTFAARFASPDRSEVLSVVIRSSNELKLSFLEAQDISDLGSLREAASLFLPGGATLYAARTIKIGSEVPRTYYFYEFSAQDRHVALEAAVSQGKVFVVGATAPRSKWEDAGSKLRSAAISFSLV